MNHLNNINDNADLCAEAPVLGLFVTRSVVRRVTAVVAEFVLVLAWNVGVLEISVVLLLVAWRFVSVIG